MIPRLEYPILNAPTQEDILMHIYNINKLIGQVNMTVDKMNSIIARIVEIQKQIGKPNEEDKGE